MTIAAGYLILASDVAGRVGNTTINGKFSTAAELSKAMAPNTLSIACSTNVIAHSKNEYLIAAVGAYSFYSNTSTTGNMFNRAWSRSNTTLKIYNSRGSGYVGNLAMFFGGTTTNSSNSDADRKTITFFNGSTRATSTESGTNMMEAISMANGYYLVGYNLAQYSSSMYSSTTAIQAINGSLTKNTGLTALTNESNGYYYVTPYMGGYNNTYLCFCARSALQAYKVTNLAKSTPQTLSVTRDGIAIAGAGNYIYVAGGRTSSSDYSYTLYNTVDIFSGSSLSRSTSTLDMNKSSCGKAESDTYVVFLGGDTATSTGSYDPRYDTAVAFKGSTKSVLSAFSSSTSVRYGISVGKSAYFDNYMCFGGAANMEPDGGYATTATSSWLSTIYAFYTTKTILLHHLTSPTSLPSPGTGTVKGSLTFS